MVEVMNLQASLKEEIIERINDLPYDLQKKVFDYIDSLVQVEIRKISGKELLKYAGVIEKADLSLINDAIEANCEQVDG